MRIDLVALCDAAVEVSGRLHVLGTIDYFWAASLPYTHPKCAFVARFRWDGLERARKSRVRVEVVDADGQAIASEFTRKFVAPVPPHEDIPSVRHLILDMDGLKFEKYGPYAVRLEIDGCEAASIPFSILPVAELPRVRPA